jgi:phosphoserine phosphatase
MEDGHKRKKIKLVVFDVDGTLVFGNLWRLLHELAGTLNKAAILYAYHKARALTQLEYLDADASLWKGQPMEKVLEIARAMPIIDGAKETADALRAAGIQLAIVSAGIDVLVNIVAKEMGITIVRTNVLLTDVDNNLTGEVSRKVLFDKDWHVREIVKDLGITLEETCFVGDGRNDINAMDICGLSISINGELDVDEAAMFIVKTNDLRDILKYIVY